MVVTTKHADLNLATQKEINRIIDEEFGSIPIVQQTEWAEPDWTIVYCKKNKIASFYNIVVRKIQIDNKLVWAGGVNNVITPPEYRGHGYASMMLRDTGRFIFDELELQCGLLLCADALLPFYKRLNWYKVDCPVLFQQKSGQKVWPANTMLLCNGEAIKPSAIDLKGLPW